MEPAVSEKKQLTRPARRSAPEVIRLRDKIANSYLVGEMDSNSWIIVDAGMSRGHWRRIVRAASDWFGEASKPAGIVLTHAHFDHVGALEALLEHWNVPVYAHPLEMPYLTGKSDYPPADPTVGGGMMARMSPLFPRKALNLGDRVLTLPEDGSIPHMPGWRWIHTPGHTAGHISLFREEDRTLIAGDAFVTVKNESSIAVLLQKEQVSRPPAYLTTDWDQARKSLELLSDLRPEIAATGHGIPMRGERLRRELQWLVENFEQAMPRDGRYVRHPAIADSQGVRYVPPAVPDPVPKIVGGIAAVALTAYVAHRVHRKRKTRLIRALAEKF